MEKTRPGLVMEIEGGRGRAGHLDAMTRVA